jgi:hypothetical protein
MPHKPKVAKKPYSAPSFRMLDSRAAQSELKANGDPKDANVQKMLSLMDEQLNRRKPTSRPKQSLKK